MRSPRSARPPDPVVGAQLAAAERAGLRLLLRGREVVLAVAAAWFSYGLFVGRPTNYAFPVILVLLVLGRLHLALIGGSRERAWHKYAFFAIDVAVLAVLSVNAPLSSGGDVPQILVFRAYGFHYLMPFIAVAALALSPSLTLWVGAVAVGALWAAFGWIVAGMERTVTWSDLPPGADAATYLKVYLDPDFIGVGDRVEETLVVLLCAGFVALAVKRARAVVVARAEADRERQDVRRLFGRYVPEQVVAAILADPASVRPQTREASVLFADIEGFTTLAEARPPAEMIRLLNDFFAAATDVVTTSGGVVIEFVGDAVLASFNAPVANSDHAACATHAGNRLLQLVEETSFRGVALRLRVGIATGPVAAGSVGGAGRQSYTVYGDTVNLAQRLEALNKELGTRLLADETTAAAAASPLTRLTTTTVRGRAEPVAVFTFAPTAARGQPEMPPPAATEHH